jgi:hypothetical protein
MKGLRTLIIAVVAALVGAAATYYLTLYSQRTRYLDYDNPSVPGILSPIHDFSSSDTINITLNGKSIENITEFDVFIANLDDQPLEDVPVFIELFNEQATPVNILSVTYFDQNNAREAVSELASKPPIHHNGRRFAFMLHTMNQSADFTEAFGVRFLIQGNSVPSVDVSVNKPGVKIRKYNPRNHRTLWERYMGLHILLQVLIGFGLFAFLMVIVAISTGGSVSIGDSRPRRVLYGNDISGDDEFMSDEERVKYLQWLIKNANDSTVKQRAKRDLREHWKKISGSQSKDKT